VTARGTAFSQFKRALERRNFLLAWMMAAELPKVPLADALALLLLALDQQPWRFERAAPRWHARLCDEAPLTLGDIAVVVAPALTAGGGAWLGARFQGRREKDAELRVLVNDAVRVLERADRRRGGAYALFVQDGANTSEHGLEALRLFRTELSEAAQLRGQIAVRVPADSPLLKHYEAALEALGEVSVAIGVAVMWPNERHFEADLKKLHDRTVRGEADYKRERDAFVAAAQRRLKG
jgi:hypothetical protein